MHPYAGIALAIAGVLLGAWLAIAFADWNKQQACATSGRRNCDASIATPR
jgi:hypothetical protein